jgi:hypothetical protein
MEQSNEVGKLMTALAKVQTQMRGAKKDAVNPHFRNKYADLASVWDAWREARGPEAGLVVTQSTRPDHEGVHVVTTLWHFSGEWIRSELFMPVTKKDPQGYGSALSYARRYAFAALVGIVAEDDDGEAASKAPPAKVTPPSSPDLGHKTAVDKLREAYTTAKTPEEVARLDIEAAKVLKGKADPMRPFLIQAHEEAVKRIENGAAA